MSWFQRRLFGKFQMQAAQQRFNLFKLFFKRLFVDTVHHGQVLRRQNSGRRHVGINHKFFDQAVAGIVFRLGNRLYQPVFTNFYLNFGNVEFQRAAFFLALSKAKYAS